MKSGLSLDLELILKKHLYKFEMQKKDLVDSFNSVLLGSYLDRTAFSKLTT